MKPQTGFRHVKLLFVAATLLFARQSAFAQFDFFGNILKGVSGINAAISKPTSGFENPNNSGESKSMPMKLSISLKYGPFLIGPRQKKIVYCQVKKVYSSVKSYKCNGNIDSACTICKLAVDTMVYTLAGEQDTIRIRESRNEYFEVCPKCCIDTSDTSTVLTSFATAEYQPHSFTLGFGYEFTSQVSYGLLNSADQTLYNIRFPLNGPFIQAMYRPCSECKDVLGSKFLGIPSCWTDWIFQGFTLGAGGSLYSIDNAMAQLHDSIAVTTSTKNVFAPLAFAGISWSGGGFAIFGDFGYEYIRFSSLSHSVSANSTLRKEAPYLPASIDLSNWFLRLGISLTTKVPGGDK